LVISIVDVRSAKEHQSLGQTIQDSIGRKKFEQAKKGSFVGVRNFLYGTANIQI